MARQAKSEANLRYQVRKLIAGPTVYICDECVGLCNEIISEDWQESRQEISAKLCKPVDIHQHLDQYRPRNGRRHRKHSLRPYMEEYVEC